MAKADNSQLREILETLYKKYNRFELISSDPLQFVYEFQSASDREAAGFIAAVFAYGRVEQIEKNLRIIFQITGKSPADFVRNFSAKQAEKFADFKYRFNTADDIVNLLTVLKKILAEHQTIEGFFVSGFKDTDENILPALQNFSSSVLQTAQSLNLTAGRGFGHFVPSPAGGSACKRLNLFLRWMVRKDDVDSGLWASIDKSKLIVPVDVHINRLCGMLGFHNSKTVSLKTAVQITEQFKKICPDDPAKYDFALSRIGIVENCTGKPNAYCCDCELLSLCAK